MIQPTFSILPLTGLITGHRVAVNEIPGELRSKSLLAKETLLLIHILTKLHNGNIKLSWLAALLVIFSISAVAQNRNAGEIRGTVFDQTGAAVPAATVTILNKQTGVTQTLTAAGNGVYDAPSVEPGTYDITFSKEGFRKLVRGNVVLHVEAITIDAQLQIGSESQQITVESGAPLVQTETSDRQMILTTEAVTQLPNIGGSWYDFTGQLPGVNPGKGGQDASGEGVGVNGTTSYLSNWLIDGGVGTFPVSQNPDFAKPPLDAVSELNFNTSNFAAEYGSGVAVFNVITKSGTNAFHGSAYEFVQNDIFEARNFFAEKVTPLRWNQYGGSVGGPIKRDKLFFFFSYQRNPINNFSPTFYTFPTTTMRNGDFSAPGLPVIYDPTSGIGQNPRTPYPGNQIPTAQIDPVAQKIQSYLPQPNRSGIANNYYFAGSNPITWTTYDGKLDFNLTASNRLTGSGLWVSQTNITPAPTCPMDCNNNDQYEYQAQVTDVWTLSPSIVNEARVSTIRTYGTWFSPNQGQGYPAKLGLLNPAADAFPGITVGGTVGTSISGGLSAVLGFTSYVTSDTVTLVKGKHIIKFGGELDKWQDNQAWDNKRSGNFDFNGIFTRNPADPTSSGLGYADFLIGLPDTWSVSNAPETGMRNWNVQAFAQDDYKIKRNLTLNFGVRYQLQTGWVEEHNRLASFDPSITNPATGTPGALWFAGQNGRNALQKTIPNFFAPRLGFAWSPRPSWSVRGGFGMFANMWGANSYTSGVGTGWSVQGFKTSTDLVTPIFSLSQGPPQPLYPNSQSFSPALLNGQGVSYFPYDTPMSYIEEWNFDIQHDIGHGLLLDAAYVGSKGVHLGFGTDINQVPASLLGLGDAQSRRPYPQYAGIDASLFDGVSFYNSLQLTARKRFGNGFSFQANYTYSKAMDTGTGSGWGGTTGLDTWQIANDWRANYGPSAIDLRHLFNGSFVYEIPIGKGRRFLDQGGIVDAIIGGWQLSSTFQFHTGLPFTPVMGTANLSGALAGTWRPNRIGSGSIANPSVQEWFNTEDFVQPAQNEFGNSGRDFLYGPGLQQVNVSLGKTFRFSLLGEKGGIQVRADSYNVLNHPNFGMPNASIGSAAQGTITSALTSRNIQLGARLTF